MDIKKIMNTDTIIIIMILICSTALVGLNKLDTDYYISVITSLISYKFGAKIGYNKAKR